MLTFLLKLLAGAFAFYCLAGSGCPVAAAEDDAGWKLVADDDGIDVYSRATSSSSIRELRAVTEIPATPERVFAVVLDSDHFVEFMPYVVEVRTVARDSPSVWYLYQRISPPIVSDRDYTLRQESVEIPQHGRYEVHWEIANDHGPPPRDGVVRVEICTGAYIVESLDGGARSRLTYELYTEPGGKLPTWLANRANRTSVPALLKAIRRRAVDPDYRR